MSYSLTIEPIGETLQVAEGQTVLDACLRAGVWLPHACCHGLCSTCKIDVLEGQVDHGAASPFALMDMEREDGKALACCATLASDLVIEADIEEDDDAEYIPVADYSGRVARLEDLTPDVKGLWIDVEDDNAAFQAGQYANFTIPGIEGTRPFSFANPPSESKRLEFHVRLVEGGAGTGYVHNQLAVGDELEFSGPYGHFFTRKSVEKPKLFIAGGSGLSALKSMVLDLLEEGSGPPIMLLHGVRGRKDLYFDQLFAELAGQHGHFSYVPALSEMDQGDDWAGETGFINEVAERHYEGRFEGNQAYLCGPPVMIEACIRSLMKGRLFEKDIFTEKFVTAADGEQALAKSPLFKRI